MIVGLGTDIVSVERIKKVLEKMPEEFIDRICSDCDKEYLRAGRDINARLAKIWAVKEAAAKALGTGIAQGIKFKDFELRHNQFGKPTLTFKGHAAEILEQLTCGGQANVVVSLSDDKPFAQAIVIIEKIVVN